ncbi:hypothetical protein LCGC14_0358920 [marine sediment metagenome]|uniref:Uncharacterized protein n=1 Tax=marine sediment metagenome TaxID=412755 RepID=A0A0F9TRN6_9ZZZZ
MQAAWVDLYDVKVGDTVKILRGVKDNEMGSLIIATVGSAKAGSVGEEQKVVVIRDCWIRLQNYDWPFFCLEKIKSKPHTIAFDGQEPVEISDKSYKALKDALN